MSLELGYQSAAVSDYLSPISVIIFTERSADHIFPSLYHYGFEWSPLRLTLRSNELNCYTNNY